MKLLIFSDSHGSLENVWGVWERLQDRMDMILHLGDYDTDAMEIQRRYPHIPVHFVRGNNDFSRETPNHKILMAGGQRLLLTHGHKERVHWNLQTLSYWAEEQDAHAVLFGHTHMAANDTQGRVLLFNPGSISRPRDSRIPTFGILTIEQGRMEGAIMEYHGNGDISRRK